MADELQAWLYAHLRCPRDQLELDVSGDEFVCPNGHRYALVQGVPVLLTDGLEATHPYCSATLARASASRLEEPSSLQAADVDPFVQDEIVKTNGLLYRHLRGRLPRYPLPTLPLGPGHGRLFLEVGSNWGRWCHSAARAGYRAIGLDPWIEAALAGGRVAHQLGGAAAFVVGDARRLPFPDGTFDVTFSYSVLQHFDKRVAVAALCEMSRVTRLGGTILVQMPNVLGIRQAFNWVRQRVKSDANVFRVRYWTPWELTRTFRETIGPTRSRADGYFSLNPQPSDVDLLPQAYALVVQASEALKTAARHVPALTLLADSLYLEAENGRAYAKSAQARVSAE